MLDVALGRLYAKGEVKFIGAPPYMEFVNGYSMRKDQVIDGNATDIVQNAIFGEENPLIKDDKAMYDSLNSILRAKIPDKLSAVDSASGIPVDVTFFEAIATAKIGNMVTLKFGFINTLTEFPPPQTQEEDAMRAWGFRNFVLRLRDVEFQDIEEDFGGFNKADLPRRDQP